MTEGENPQEGVTSQVEETPQEESTQIEEQTQEAISDEKIQQLVAEKVEGELYRLKQSLKDTAKREVLEAQRRATLAEGTSAKIKSRLSSYDPDSGQDLNQALEQAENESKLDYYQKWEEEQKQRQAQEAYNQSLNESLEKHLEALGIPRDDKRIDWANDAPDFLTGRNKFDASVARILKENQVVEKKAMDDKLKEIESKLRIDLGLESHEPFTSAGVDTSEASFMEKYNAGELDSLADHKRAKKILDDLK